MSGDSWKLQRREFLAAMAAVGARLGLGGSAVGCAAREGQGPPPEAPPIPADAFQLGVASGDPLHDRVILWTRLAPEPMEADWGMPDVEVPVVWEVFADEAMTDMVATGWVWAVPAFAHAAHADASGLDPATTYWFRFRVGDVQVSPTGRTRTLPAPESSPERVRIALACCQKYSSGFYSAYAHLAEAELDAVLHLGDYIYESGSNSRVEGRLPIDTERVTDLAGFRERYAGYRMDAQLQAAHAAHPWIVVWDDHEVSNNYANLTLSEPRRDDGDPTEMRRGAYQAWYEHMPVRIEAPEDALHLKIYRSFQFGDLVTLAMLDTRQYRDPQPCDDRPGVACDDIFDGGRTLLGEAQLRWLGTVLEGSDARWNLIGQQVLFSPVLTEVGLANPDQWDGYMDDRQAVLDLLARPEVRSPIVLSGDVHAAGFGELYADQWDPSSPTVAIEVLTTSISSGGDGADGIARFAAAAESLSDSIHYFDAARRGFAVLDVQPDQCEVTYFAVTTVLSPEADLYVVRRYTIAANSLTMAEVERND